MSNDQVLIPVTYKGQTLYTTIDKEDEGRIAKHRWTAGDNGKGKLYVFRFEVAEGQQKKKYLHREIMSAKQGEFIDHINGDGLLNTKANLRVTDHQGNSRNRKKAKTYRGKPTKSKYKGVTRNRNGSWAAYIKSKYLGTFKSEREAAQAYDAKAKELFDAFARLNLSEGA